MDSNDAYGYIVDRVAVTRQMVTIAKSLMLAHLTRDTYTLIRTVTDNNNAKLPETVVLHRDADPIPQLMQVVHVVSWRYASCEALWGLIHSNMLLPRSPLQGTGVSVRWTTGFQGSGGHSSGWTFDGPMVPQEVEVAPSQRADGPEQPLSDPDLYLHELNLPGIHEQVEAAIREAVVCFRHELYTACLVMLGSACEGAWTQLGLSLVNWPPEPHATRFAKLRREMSEQEMAMARVLREVIRLYEHQEVFKPLADRSGVTLQELRAAVIWADAVRDARNAIHFNVQPAMKNTYEKVAALLIGAVSHLRLIYHLEAATKPVEV